MIDGNDPGSSRGRGTRAAAWFRDYVRQQKRGDANGVIRSAILEGGIKGWAKAGEEFTALMQEYDPFAWL